MLLPECNGFAHRRQILIPVIWPHSSPIIETAMIWPRRLDNQPAHRWLHEIFSRVIKGLGSE
jgi:hypothetical protein